MEIKAYLKIFLKRWWALLLGVSVVILATWYFTNQQPRVYESTTTFVIRPVSATIVVDDDFVKALDIVSRRVEINSTFAEVATSKLIKTRAIEAMGDVAEGAKGFSVTAGVIGGTNILKITVEGPTPVLTQDFAMMVAAETLKFGTELYDVYELQPLDPASLPKNPIRPSLLMNLMIGGVLGLALGVGLVFLIEIILSPYEAPDTFNIIDRDTGAYNKTYLTLRLWQEMSRSKRNDYPLSLGLIKVELDGENITPRDRNEVMKIFKKFTDSQIREDDVLACVNGNTFAIIYSHVQNDQAKTFIDRLEDKFASIDQDVLSTKGGVQIKNSSAVITYQGGFINEAEFLEKGIHELQTTSVNGSNGRVSKS